MWTTNPAFLQRIWPVEPPYVEWLCQSSPAICGQCPSVDSAMAGGLMRHWSTPQCTRTGHPAGSAGSGSTARTAMHRPDHHGAAAPPPRRTTPGQTGRPAPDADTIDRFSSYGTR